jgi:hypothetical protein
MQAVLVQGQLKLDRLQGDLGQREQARDRLELQVNTLESPDRLAQAAGQLGMVPAPQVMFLYADPAAGTDHPPTTGPVATPDTLAASPPTTAPAPPPAGANGTSNADADAAAPGGNAEGTTRATVAATADATVAAIPAGTAGASGAGAGAANGAADLSGLVAGGTGVLSPYPAAHG